jgi:hypothetical protein
MMKNLLKKSILGASALVFGLALVFSQSAFKTHKDSVVYQYTYPSASPADIRNILHWEVADLESPSCGEEGPLVCQYTFEGDMGDFQEFIEDEDNTITEINTLATARKLAP